LLLCFGVHVHLRACVHVCMRRHVCDGLSGHLFVCACV
jgi:hypothetical protein